MKYYAWEKPFMKKVEDTRNKEVLYSGISISVAVYQVSYFP